MTSGKSAKEESSSPGCMEIFAFSIALIFLLASCFFIFQAIRSFQQGETFPLLCLSFFAVVLAGFSIVATYNIGKTMLIKHTLETDLVTGGPVVTTSLFGKTISTKTGSPPRKIELNLEAPATRYPPSIVTLHHAAVIGLSRRGGMKWYRYPASLIEGPVAVLGAIQVIDFYQIVFKEETITGKSETSVEFFVRPGPRCKAKINVLQERRIIEIVCDWDERRLPYGIPLYTLAEELFSRYYFNTPWIMLREIMKDAKNQGLGDIKRLGTVWQTSPEHATALNDDSDKFKRFMEQLQMQHPELGAALKEKSLRAIPKRDDESLTIEQQKQAIKQLFSTDWSKKARYDRGQSK